MAQTGDGGIQPGHADEIVHEEGALNQHQRLAAEAAHAIGQDALFGNCTLLHSQEGPEAFSAKPFDYEFLYAPMGDEGVYAYIEPWYGFAVNKDSSQRDYAVEFLRFMARQDELNTLASVKGVPSVAKQSQDTRYDGLNETTKVACKVVSDASLPASVGTALTTAAAQLLSGECPDADAAPTGQSILRQPLEAFSGKKSFRRLQDGQKNGML